jgi:hypothetical protein
VHRQILDMRIAHQPEQQSQNTDDQTGEQDLVPGKAQEVALVEVRQAEVHLAAGPVLTLDALLGNQSGQSGGEKRHPRQ